MLDRNSEQNVHSREEKPREGDLYKVIKTHGVTFEIYYGYYEESDRQTPHIEPLEMYPNFINNPVYTDEGIPFVTAMQMPCEYFEGEPDDDNTCYQCFYYQKCEELLGVCTCLQNMKPNDG